MRGHESPISRIIAVVTASVLIIGACGTDDLETSPVSSTSQAAEPTTSTTSAPVSSTTTTTTTTGVPASRVVSPGAAVLAAADFDLLAGRRVGLIANHTSLVGDTRLIDLLAAHPSVELAAIFAPEHGVTGTVDAGELVDDGADRLVEVPVFSLYGETRQPTAEMLAGLDVLVYDLQDAGTRFYTYISTMGLAMQAAAAAGLPFVVLDRPNPLGGELVAGFVRTETQESFISQYPIPSIYGLTAGELADAIRGEGWLDGVSDLDLTVVEMDGWRRSDRWPDTGLEWIPPSPGLPGFASAAAYPGTVLFEATSISYGRGTREPFAVIGAPWADGGALASDLESRSLPGVTFESVSFTPEVLDIAPSPRLLGVPLDGVRIVATDPGSFDPVAVGIHLMEAFQTQADAAGAGSIIDRAETFDLLAGTSELRQLLGSGVPAAVIISAWQDDVEEFAPIRERHLRYGP